MSDLQSPDRLTQHALAALIPFFIESPTSDANAARIAAGAILSDYKPATPKELQLSTEIIALGWASLGCLRAAVAAKHLSLDEKLALQDNAIALDRASQKSTRLLNARRKDRAKDPRSLTPENTRWDEGAFQLTINKAMEKLNDANAKFAAYMQTLTPAVETPKLRLLAGEQMTPSLLARRASQH